MFGVVIDKNGYKVTFVVLNEDKIPQYYELQENESIIEAEWNIANAMNKPQWNGKEWIDTDPLPLIEAQPQQPTEIEILQGQLEECRLEQVRLHEMIIALEGRMGGNE